MPGKSVIKFAGALQSSTVCLWDEGHFMARMHLPQHRFIFLIHPTDKESPVTYDTEAQGSFGEVKLYKDEQYIFISEF